MPHRDVEWAQWIEDLAANDPCLGRIVKEAVVAKDAAEKAGANVRGASARCRKAFKGADDTLNSVRFGLVRPNTDVAWKRAADALRKFTKVLDCASGAGLDKM